MDDAAPVSGGKRGEDLAVARLEDILRSKEAAGRPKDRQDALLIREMLKRR